MPTYEYKCERCGKVFEKFQKMSDKLLKTCPGCKGKVHRLIGAGSGIIFKGSGFYHTDYKNPSTLRQAQCRPEQSRGTTRAQGSIPSEARDKNPPAKAQGADKESCPKPKSEGCPSTGSGQSRAFVEGCKNCSLNKDKENDG